MKIYILSSKSIFSTFLILAAIIIILSLAGIIGLDAIDAFNEYKDLPIYSVDNGKKQVSITFDCAWGDGDIPEILKTLKDKEVPATFFIVGQWAEKFPHSVSMIAAAGHDIANHSYSHLRMSGLDDARMRSEISLCGQKLAGIAGSKVELFRAPYGDYNSKLINTARSLGYYSIQWDVDSLDWKPGISGAEIISRVSRKVKPGSIILFHNDTPFTAKVLPDVIDMLQKQEYELVPVSRLILRENYFIDHEGRQKSQKTT